MLNIAHPLLLQARDHHQAGRRDQAQAACRQLLALQPQNAQALYLLGILTHERGQHEAACQLIIDAINTDPTVIQYYTTLAAILPLAQRSRKAVEVLEQALTLAPDSPDVLTNLGCALRRCGRVHDALPYYRRAVELAPTNAYALSNLAVGLADLHLWDQAADCYEKTLTLEPNNPRTHWNYALLLLAQGDFDRGWEHWEWRLKSPDLHLHRNFQQPPWDGNDRPSQTVLLHTEGGFGDAFMFIRCVPLLRTTHTRLLLECQPSLVELFSATPAIANAVDQIIPRGQPLPPFDSHLSILSLPRLQKIRLDNIPNQVPYLTVPPAHLERWSTRIPKDNKLNIGLMGSTGPNGAGWRAMTPDLFAPLTTIENTRVFSLQKDPLPTAPNLNLIDHTPDLRDFTNTAALIHHLDLIITVDTSIAHLAGALARPTWTLLPTPSDFRWLHDRPDTPWYPTMRLFRQSQMGNWQTVLAQVQTELTTLAKSKSH